MKALNFVRSLSIKHFGEHSELQNVLMVDGLQNIKRRKINKELDG